MTTEDAATRRETVEAFVVRSKRHKAVGIRQTFLQTGRGNRAGPGPLARFVRSKDKLGLEIYLLLLLRGRGRKYGEHFVDVQAGTWARALNLNAASANQVLSRALTRLTKMCLIRKQKRARGVRIQLLREDASGAEYSPPGSTDAYFQLPLEYWLHDDYLGLTMPAKAMLLISLGEQEEFELPVARVNDWYGISTDTATRGFDQLVRAGIISTTRRLIKDPMHPAGRRISKLWRLAGAYDRKRLRGSDAVNIRRVK